MSKMYSKGFKPKSTTKKAKAIIRNEALGRWGKNNGYYDDKRTRLQRMKSNADSYNAGVGSPSNGYRYQPTDYQKGAALVDAGCYRCYYSDQREFLSKIYGKSNVEGWENDKVHNTYKHLIGREYDAMLREKRNKKKKKR